MTYSSTIRKDSFTIRKNSVINACLFVVVLISFLFSKTVFFGIYLRSVFQWIFYFSCIFSCIILGGSIGTLKKNLLIIAPFIFLLAIQIAQFRDFSSDGLNTIIGHALTFVACCCFASTITKEQFKRYYCTILTIMCLVSLVCFTLTIVAPEVAKSLSQTNFNWDNTHEYSWFYTWGSSGNFFGRNAGMFWEPGAFQGFIFIGLFMVIDTSIDKYDPNRKIKVFQFILFFITLLTTRSTTAYIMCLLFCVVFYRRIAKLFAGKSKYGIVIYILIFIAAVATIVFIALSNNISDKLNNVQSESASIRFNDLIRSIELAFSGQGLIGYGQTVNRDLIEAQYSLVKNSIGLLSMSYTYGILFSLYYVVRMFISLRNIYCRINRIEFLTLFVIFIVLHMTEGLWNLPIYILMLMAFKPDKSGVNN